MSNLAKFERFHCTWQGYLSLAAIELGLAYGAVSWAIDSGNVLLYLVTVILLCGGIVNLVKMVVAAARTSRLGGK